MKKFSSESRWRSSGRTAVSKKRAAGFKAAELALTGVSPDPLNTWARFVCINRCTSIREIQPARGFWTPAWQNTYLHIDLFIKGEQRITHVKYEAIGGKSVNAMRPDASLTCAWFHVNKGAVPVLTKLGRTFFKHYLRNMQSVKPKQPLYWLVDCQSAFSIHPAWICKNSPASFAVPPIGRSQYC